MTAVPSLTRNRARQLWETHGFPTTRQERWKYVNFRSLKRVQWTFGTDESKREVPGQKPDWAAAELRFIGGQLDKDCVLPEGITVSPVDVEDTTHQPAGDQPDQAFAWLNTAYARQAYTLTITRALDAPIVIRHFHASEQADVCIQTRLQVNVESGASAHIVEHYGSEALGSERSLSNVWTDINIADHGRLYWSRLQESNTQSHVISRTDTNIAANGQFHYCGLDVGGGIVRHDINARLLDPLAQCHLSGVYAPNGKSIVDNHSQIAHVAGETISREHFKGVVLDQARAVFNGKVIVHEGADQSDAQQSNGNLLLSDSAEVDTKPELEIYADEVVCAHGVTVGQLEPEMLFYLRSRGISNEQARRMLTMGFCRAPLADIPHPCVQSRFEAALEQRLEHVL